MAVFTVLNGTGINGAGIQFGTLAQIGASGVVPGFPAITPTTGTINFNDGGRADITGTGMSLGLTGNVTGITYSRPVGTPIFSVTGFTEPLFDIAPLLFGGGDELTILADVFSEADTITGSSVNDRLMGFGGADVLDGGDGIDTLSYQGSTSGTGIFMAIDGTAGLFGDADGDVALNFENIVGSEVGDVLLGNAGDNILVGRAGADNMSGRAGNDSYDVDNAGDIVTEFDNNGTDAIYTSISWALAAGASIEKLVAHVAAGTINLAGNELKQSIYGNASNNSLTGGGGGDGLIGNGGNDIFDYNAAGDSTPGTGAFDVINGFSAGDLIDLQDVFGGTLVFRGTSAYTGAAGEVRYTAVGATGAVIRVNLDGDLADEMQIYVIGTAAPVAGDFLL